MRHDFFSAPCVRHKDPYSSTGLRAVHFLNFALVSLALGKRNFIYAWLHGSAQMLAPSL